MRKYRVPLAIVAALVLIAAAVYYLLRPKPVEADAAVVDRGTIETAIEAEAKTRVREPYVVSAPLTGRLLRIQLHEGDRVRKGQAIANIDPLPAISQVRQAIAQLDEMRAQETGVETLRPKNESIAQARSREAAAAAAYAQAQRDRQRAQSLISSGYIPRTEFEAAVLSERTRALELVAARAAVAETLSKRADPDYLIRVYRARADAVRAQLRTLEDQAARTTIFAPVSGTVLALRRQSEENVTAGAPLLEIGDVRDLEIAADVLSQDAVGMKPGDAIVIERGAGNNPVHARVVRIDPSAHMKVSALGVEEQRVNVIGRFEKVPAGVRDQYRLDVRIVTWRGRTLRVPSAALFRCGQAWCVYRIVGGKARRATVAIGRRGTEYAQVLSGLVERDRVVLHPSDDVDEGTALSVRLPKTGEADNPE